jgi:hypothetical protein
MTNATKGYGIWLHGTGWVTSASIRERCVKARLPRQIDQIDRIETRGITYSGEDFDILSRALRVLEEFESPDPYAHADIPTNPATNPYRVR